MRRGLVRGLVVLGGLATCWTIVVLWTGGGVWSIAGVRISSRGPRNPTLLVLVSVLLAWAISSPGSRGTRLAAEYRWFFDLPARLMARVRPPAAFVAGIAAAGVVLVGFTEGAWVVAASDSYGYVSQAHLWTIGALRQEPALAPALAGDVSLDVLTPLGYRPSIDGKTIAPTYPSGLPIVMAVFETLAGSDSVFWVVPMFAGVLVWATYLLGARLYSSIIGALAAVFVATSPPVLVQLTDAPMSDVPAAALWMVAMVLATSDRRINAFGAGGATGLAILTRPNLVPLAAIVLGLLLARLIAAGRSRGHVVQHVALFSLLSVSASLVTAAINNALWGSPLTSGHGTLRDLFSLSNVWSNVVFYPLVFVRQVPIVLALPVGWLLRRSAFRWRVDADGDRTLRLGLGTFAVLAVLVYIAYPAYESRWNLRFLIPAIPAVLVLACFALFLLAGRLSETERMAALLALAVIAGYGVHTARALGAFEREHVRRYAVIGRYVERELADHTVLFAMLHSGSATYYSGRPTLRFDLLPPAQLDSLVATLQQRGYEPYLLVDSQERLFFQDRFRGHSRLAALDWPPLVSLHSPSVEIYSVRDATPRP